MSKEICLMCDDETGRAGKSDDSIYPILKWDFQGPTVRHRKGDVIGPLCEKCYDAFLRFGMIEE